MVLDGTKRNEMVRGRDGWYEVGGIEWERMERDEGMVWDGE